MIFRFFMSTILFQRPGVEPPRQSSLISDAARASPDERFACSGGAPREPSHAANKPLQEICRLEAASYGQSHDTSVKTMEARMAEHTEQQKAAEKKVTDELANEADASSRHGDESPQANEAKDHRAQAESEVSQARK
jgi:hypothetical protein